MSLKPQPRLRIHLDDLSHPATAKFLSLVDGSRLLSNAINHILKHLYHLNDSYVVPPTRSVTLILRSMDGVAYTTGIELDDEHKEIHFSLDHIERSSRDSKRCRSEIIGVVTHEMVHCYQYNANGTAPGGLIEGIADYVRLKADLAPPHWDRAQPGEKWDAGYQQTAFFLEWLETKIGPGTVGKINETLRNGKYQEKGPEGFWEGLFGKGVGVFWEEYKISLGGGDEQIGQGEIMNNERVEDEKDDESANSVRETEPAEEEGLLVERKESSGGDEPGWEKVKVADHISDKSRRRRRRSSTIEP